MLKGLVEEVLNEVTNVDLTNIKINQGKYVKKSRSKKGFDSLGWDTSKFSSHTNKVDSLKQLANLDGNISDLSPKDVADGYTTQGQSNRAKELHAASPSDFKKEVDALLSTPPADTPLQGELGKPPYNLKTKSTGDQFQAASERILSKINNYATLTAQSALYVELMNAFKGAHGVNNSKYKAELGKMAQKVSDHPAPPAPPAPPLSSTDIPDIPSSDDAIDISNTGLDIDSRPLTNPLGDVSTKGQYDSANTINDFSGKVSVDSSLYNMFNAVAGDDIGAKFSRLNQVAEILDTTKSASLDNATHDDILLFANDLAILSKIGNLAKEMGSSGAGFELEGMLAGLLGGYTPAGKGTSDMITGKGGSMEFYSAKLVASKPGQSWMGEKGDANNGMYHHLKESNVYYITLFKKNSKQSTTTAATAYDVLEVHITKLNKNTKLSRTGDHPWSKVEGSYLDSTGSFQTLDRPLGALKTGPTIAKGSTPFVSLRLLQKPNASAFAIGKRIEQFVNNKGGILKSVMDASRRIQNMDANTKEYRAVRGSGANGKAQNGTSSSLDYVQAIATDYAKIKSDFQKIFTDAEKTGSKVDGAQVFKEQKITANLLKKLIQEKFKK